MKYYIGFANKYYTLWEMTTSTQVSNGVNYTVETYTYLQNLSYDKNEAFKKAPEGAVFNENLKGISKSFETREMIINDDEFHCGKYVGTKFNETSDFDYLMWFHNHCAYHGQKENIENILIPKGYGKIKCFDGTFELITPADAYERDMYLTKLSKTRETLNNANELVVLFEKNLDDEGYYYDKNLETLIHFSNYDVKEYNGYYYAMPLDKKSKAKRIKNKTIKITNFVIVPTTDDERNKINVIDWEFVK